MQKLISGNGSGNAMKVYNFTVLIEQDEEGWYVAKAPDIPGCATQGRTVKEALARVREAIKLCLDADKRQPASLKLVDVKHVAIKA